MPHAPRVFVTFLGEPHHDRPLTLQGLAPWAAGEEREFTADLTRQLGRDEATAVADFAEFWAGVRNAGVKTDRFALRTEGTASTPADDSARNTTTSKKGAKSADSTPAAPAQE